MGVVAAVAAFPTLVALATVVVTTRAAVAFATLAALVPVTLAAGTPVAIASWNGNGGQKTVQVDAGDVIRFEVATTYSYASNQQVTIRDTTTYPFYID